MIKLERTSVMNFDNAIRGMRNSMNSWGKSDSVESPDCESCEHLGKMNCLQTYRCFILGEDDLGLAQKLVKAGSDHRKFLRQIFVSVDVTAPLYWWKEYDTYKVGTVANSCSTMHKIHSKEFTIEDFSCERLSIPARQQLRETIKFLEKRRLEYNSTKDKRCWHDMIQLLPSSYNQLRTCTLTYENLVNIYHARKAHKLDEWRAFCVWIESLPYAKELICGEDSGNEA